MTNPMQAAHIETRRIVAEQIATKHPSAHRKYAEILASVLRGQAIVRRGHIGRYRASCCHTLTRAQRDQIGV